MDLSAKNQLASSSGDGTIRVWNLDTSTSAIKTFDGFERVNEFEAAKAFTTPSFDPKGNLLAFPKGSFIHIHDTSSWEMKFKLENDEITGKYSVCGISGCGSFVAAGSLNGEISVWTLADKSKLKGQCSGEDTHAITSLAWNPKNNGELAFCDIDGQLSTIVTGTSKGFMSDEAEEENIDEPAEDDVDDLYGAIDFRDDGDEDNENCVSLEKLKNETLKTGRDSDDEDEDRKTVKSLTSVTPSERMPVAKPFLVQPPFQPGSTPIDLEHRFMVWNHVGQVICHSADENSIIAEFHDVTIHPSLHILNNLNHEMASLSTSCLALATKETPCRLVCIAFISAGSKEWSTTMPDCEEIQAIAAGDSFVAAATDAGFIRFFTPMGTQREAVVMPGQVLALAAHDNKLAIAYHTSNTCNKLSLMIFTLLGPTMNCRSVELPLTPSTKLSWLGFSDMGSVIAYDSSGRVISYNIKRNIWYPICDMMNHVVGASDNFFIISVSESDQKIRTTLCRGTNYPLTNPRPIVREVDYSLPLCYMETEKSKLEEALVRATSFSMESSEKTIVESGLKLFSSALNSELESRAYDLLELIGNKKLIELAAKYCSQKGRIHMANKINKLLMDHEEKQKQKEAEISAFDDVEMFSETYEMQTPRAAEKRVQETSTPIPLIAPKPIANLKRMNPFKKSGSGKFSTPTSSLSHLTNKSIGLSDTTNNSDDENTPTNNVSSKSVNRSVAMDTPRPGNFSQWFIANKADLKTDNPEAADIDLMKIGKNLYKELTQKQKTPGEDSIVEISNTTSVNKRKLNMNPDEKPTGGISKLAKYGFVQD
jgi:chromosome transmission fidelity protein 4